MKRILFYASAILLGVSAAVAQEADEPKADETVVEQAVEAVEAEAKVIELWVKRHIIQPTAIHIHDASIWCHFDEARALHCGKTRPVRRDVE